MTLEGRVNVSEDEGLAHAAMQPYFDLKNTCVMSSPYHQTADVGVVYLESYHEGNGEL